MTSYSVSYVEVAKELENAGIPQENETLIYLQKQLVTRYNNLLFFAMFCQLSNVGLRLWTF